MLELAATVLLAPALVAAATLAAGRWGTRAGGIVSAFPAIVGPVLVIDLLMHDAEFTARAAAGTLIGLVALAAFVAVYGRLAVRTGWVAAVLGAWGAAAVVGAGLAGVDAGPLAAAAAAAAALVAAAWVLPAAAAAAATPVPVAVAGSPQRDLVLRMAAVAVLVVALAAAASALGPFAGGLLAALPILASVLAVFTHRRDGAGEAVALLRGMVGGMGGFLAFCLAVALLVEPAGPAAAFAVATAAAVAAQLVAAVAAG